MPSGECGGFKGVAGGKFLVLRRDGSVPDWSWFVLGAADPYAVPALKEYAYEAHAPLCTKEQWNYSNDVYQLAQKFNEERLAREAAGRKKGDPEAPPHRVDDPLVVGLMTGKIRWEDVRDLVLHSCAIVDCCGPAQDRVNAAIDEMSYNLDGNKLDRGA